LFDNSHMVRERMVLGRASARWRRLLAASGVHGAAGIGMCVGAAHCNLGDDEAVAHQHALISWRKDCFVLQRLHATGYGVSVDGADVGPGEHGCRLRSGSLVQMGHACFMFLLPQRPQATLPSHSVVF
jgi:hypothetical protein